MQQQSSASPDTTDGIETPQRTGLARLLPSAEWLSEYRVSHLPKDLLAGFLVAGLLLPQAMAYALLAELPPQTGLYAALAPALIFVFFSTSRFVSVGPVALISLLVADAIAVASSEAPGLDSGAIALVLALEVGILLLLLGVLRLGFLVNFVSDPVLTGFTSAAAILIGVSQLKNLLGLEIERGGFLATVTSIGARIAESNPWTLILGLGVLGLLVANKLWLERWLSKTDLGRLARVSLTNAFPLAALAAATAAVWWGRLDRTAGVQVVGDIRLGLPPLTLPAFDPALWQSLLPTALAIATLIFVIGVGIAKTLAGRRRQRIDPDKEAIALGLGNLAGSLTGAYPVGVSFSRSALAFDSGARTPAAMGFSALAVLLGALALSPALRFLPTAALAAQIVSAVFGLVDLRAMAKIWRSSWVEGAILTLTLLGVLLAGLQVGIAVGALSGIGLYLWHTSRPRIVIEAPLGESLADFRDAERDATDEAALPESILVVRVDQDIYFGNTSYVEQQILREVADRDEVTHVVMDLKSISQIDFSGLEMLKRFIEYTGNANLRVSFSEAKRPVVERLRSHGIVELVGEHRLFLTTREAVQALLEPSGDPGPQS